MWGEFMQEPTTKYTKTLKNLKKVRFILKLVCIFLIFLVILGGAAYFVSVIKKAPDIDEINIYPEGYATFIYDTNEEPLQKLASYDSNRTGVTIEQMPVNLQHAIVSAEDERFYSHNGIDIKGIIRAIFQGIKSGFRFTQGGSTITQQLLKNNVFKSWTEESGLIDRMERKIQEQYLALQLEKKLQDKNLILECYLNTINFGAGTYGCEAAALRYFNKDVWELNLSECTVIAGIPQNPSKYNPITHPEWNSERRDRVLFKMHELGYITEEQARECKEDNVYERIQKAQDKRAAKSSVYSYFTDAIVQKVISDLRTQMGYTKDEATDIVFSGGLKIYSTQDSAVQKICDEEFTDDSNFPKNIGYMTDWKFTAEKDGETKDFNTYYLNKFIREHNPEFSGYFKTKEEAQAEIDACRESILNDGYTAVLEQTNIVPQPQAALIVIDHSTGYVRAMEGARGEKTASLILNRATQVKRQPGTTFKILSAYAEAIESGKMTAGSHVTDEPYYYKDGTPVKNTYKKYKGEITLREAIAKSVNTVAVKILTAVGADRCFERLSKFGFTSLSRSYDIKQGLVLGNTRNGVTDLELTAAYAAIANNGTYVEPVLYTRVLDHDGNILLSNVQNKQTAVSSPAAFILTDTMVDVIKKGTGKDAALTCKTDVAGESGTTSNNKDRWFVGFTPYYTMGIWSGCDINAPLPKDDNYRKYHIALWGKIMDRIISGKEEKQFQKPDTVQKVRICADTNKLATHFCKNVTNDYVFTWNIPKATCTTCELKARAEEAQEENTENAEEVSDAEE